MTLSLRAAGAGLAAALSGLALLAPAANATPRLATPAASSWQARPAARPVVRAGTGDARTFVRPAPHGPLMPGRAPSAGSSTPGATAADRTSSASAPASGASYPGSAPAHFTVVYHGFPAPAQAAFQAAVDLWAPLLGARVPIAIDATWTDLGSTGILGSAGPSNYETNTAGTANGQWYPEALADQLNGARIDPSSPDIVANFNSTFSSWYFGTDGNVPSGAYDLESVVLHELGHGLGFGGSMTVDSQGVGAFGYSAGSVVDQPVGYDLQGYDNATGQYLTNMANHTAALASALTDNNIYWNGASGVAALGGQRPRLFAPSSWQQGSSFSHLSEAAFPAGDLNSLMTPALNPAEAVHDPGPVTLGILNDIGWAVATTTPSAPRAAVATLSANTQTATVTWQPPLARGGTTITGYEITASPGGATVTTGPSSLSATFGGLTAGDHAFAVVARNAAGSSPPATTPPVHSDAVPLTVTSFGALAVDDVHHHVFVSSGPSGSEITVYGLDGSLIRHLTNASGPAGLVLSDDSSTLYAALPAGNAVEAVDTTTFAVTTLPTGAATCPTWPALAGNRLWVGQGCNTTTALASTPLSAPGTWTATPIGLSGGGAPYVSGGRAATSSLTVGTSTGSGDTLATYLVAGGASAAVTLTSHANPGGLAQEATSAAGSTAYLAAGSTNGITSVAPSSGTTGPTYPLSGPAVSASVTPDGRWLAGAIGTGVAVFDTTAGTGAVLTTFPGTVVPRGTALEGNGRRLLIVTSDGGLVLHLADGPVDAITRYVAQVYTDLLHRPADASGAAYWHQALSSGTPRGAIANAFTASDESRGHLVDAVYQTFLGRPADAGGRSYWVGRLDAGLTIEDLKTSFVAAPEYYAQAANDPRTFVAHVYRDILRRSPDKAGSDYWTAQVSQGKPRGGLAAAIVSSREALGIVVDDAFRTYLGRPSDGGGQAYFTDLILGGYRDEQMIAQLIGSDEYFARANV